MAADDSRIPRINNFIKKYTPVGLHNLAHSTSQEEKPSGFVGSYVKSIRTKFSRLVRQYSFYKPVSSEECEECTDDNRMDSNPHVFMQDIKINPVGISNINLNSDIKAQMVDHSGEKCGELNLSGGKVDGISPRNKSPVTIQEWVDSLPAIPVEMNNRDEGLHESMIASSDIDTDNLTLGAEAVTVCDSMTSPINITITSCDEPSEVDSHCSSVDSLLEARKPDPEAILLGLGFGGPLISFDADTGRIPKRFLKPSQLKGVNIDEFLKHEQELIDTFESGYYGYHGLAGPSHSNPSSIVSKIMERLREHERVSTIASSYSHLQRSAPGKYLCQTTPMKLPKKTIPCAGRNVLNAIRYVPVPGSVLTPDNRKWLDNQGDKSPDTSRRIIIGQESFVFGRDGNLINSPPLSHFCHRDRDTVDEHVVYEDAMTEEKEANCTGSGVGEIRHGPYGESKDEQYEGSVYTPYEENFSSFDSSSCTSSSPSSCDLHLHLAITLSEKNNGELGEEEAFKRDKYRGRRRHRDKADGFVSISLKEELQRVPMGEVMKQQSIAGSIDCEDILSIGEGRYALDKFSHQSNYKISESNCFAVYSNKILQKQYEELIQLKTKLQIIGCPLSSIESEDQYSTIAPEQVIINQRSAVQSRVVRHALKAYLDHLKDSNLHADLKACLSFEVEKVKDLLDCNAPDSSKLSIVIKQILLLLQHQHELEIQLRELSSVENKPSDCHEICTRILKRVQELETLVRKNAQDLKCEM